MVFLTELLPGSSSSSSTHDYHDPHHNHRYDVFMSFRGTDTRNRFTDHLYNALLDAGINTFLDDEEIETGEPLKQELKSAIKSSRAAIIVLSKNYASSTWCLDELVLILDQMRKFNQIVIPIFYDVEPTHVRKQQHSFGEAMAQHQRNMESETNAEKRIQFAQKMDSWKEALTEVADLKGLDVKDKKETVFIKEVVTDIHHRLGVPLNNTLPLLVGMDYYLRFISSWLTDGSCHSADILTIVGIGGIGKTSLARYVFGLHSSKFDKSSFIENIDIRCTTMFSGLLDLQKQLLGDISKKMEFQVYDFSVFASKIKNALANKKVLLVLDDVGCLDQLDGLLGNEAFHQGSKIIITTKDASLTKRCALFNLQVQPKHTKISMNGLTLYDSLKLLCIHAFEGQEPKEGYEEVSRKLVKYCDGHPLALQILGRSLQKRDVAYWEECIKVLKKEPHSRINKVIKMSFDSLPFDNDKDLFKDIACFFVGEDRNLSETILNACDRNTSFGITNLIERCLLSIGQNNKLMMHQLVQEMGRDLVRQESPKKPWKRSRSWCHEESMQVLKQKKGKGNMLGLALDMRMLDKNKLHKLEAESLCEMDNLRLLQLNYVQLNECFQNFPKELRWLGLHGFPLESIQLDIPMENLVALDMSYSSIEFFDMSNSNPQPPAKRKKGFTGSSSNDKRLLGSLKILDLSFCATLHSLGGFSELPALERLILRNCLGLIEVCESVGQCDELAHIDIRYCYKLRKLPKSVGKLKKVKTLLLDGCNSCESQIKMGNVKAIPSVFKFSMIPLPSSLRILSLANNKLSNECFPTDLSSLVMLEELCLHNNPFVSMPKCVRTLPRLERLGMNDCYKMISIENPPRTLRELSVYSRSREFPLRKIKFDPEMSPLNLFGLRSVFSCSFEFDGMVKMQGIANVEKKVLRSLGWINLDFIKERRWKTLGINPIEFETQMFYEFGIFSTFYEGKEMPYWIRHRSKGPSISLTIPSSPKKLCGLNFCSVETRAFINFLLPMIKISNITKNHTWIYKHCIQVVNLNGNKHYYEDGESHSEDGEEHLEDVGKYCLSWLSHWMFGPNEMKAGDHITITVADKFPYVDQHTIECGIGLMYDEDGKNEEEEEEDVLGYYKSWNHIIGGDLSRFQLTTGEYILNNEAFKHIQLKHIHIIILILMMEPSLKKRNGGLKHSHKKGVTTLPLDHKASASQIKNHKGQELKSINII